MNIGELARQTGVSIRSLRYYEAKQLLSPHRAENGYRFYDQTAIERVRTIQFYLGLGLSTNEIFDIVFCSNSDELAKSHNGTDIESCPEGLSLYQEKLAEIENQIASLEKARAYLTQRVTAAGAKQDARNKVGV
ncbi:MerR family transcriptional regulator [Ktedonosporobacter rubrisoli]|uniref:MerR family transcriptional regulator n=1 Tax=Ktedonosporobacter rubrisoli TaxID=2509675 RepID=A0A4P6JXD4_KTERU|nr:MerR family transcriptional regulator [Ktedonosporobacter rubrisoli]QBD80294.1 MerR family transcriptional regulator [Ktedonosporobacter rubrisoli]